MRNPSIFLGLVFLCACGDRAPSGDGARATDSVPAQALAPETAAPADPPASPAAYAVQVGGEEGLDACGGMGTITPPAAGERVEVRAGPGEEYAVVDGLEAGTTVSDCDEHEGWTGIVYPQPGSDADCGVSSPIAARGPYTGPCRSGWVPSSASSLVAG